jgi:hypothetical protein
MNDPNHHSKAIYLNLLTEFSDVSEMTDQEFHDTFCEKRYNRCNFSDLRRIVAEHYGLIARQMPEDTPFLHKIVSGGYHTASGANGARKANIKRPDFAMLEILCLVPSRGTTQPFLRESYIPLDNFWNPINRTGKNLGKKKK